LKHALNK